MKQQTLTALVTAKRLLDQSSVLCAVREAHSCSAGVVVLQDSVELILLACLIELGVDESQNIESLSFDHMIGQLRKLKISLPKSGVIKAMNKQRVLIKHYGQTVDPDTARNYLQVSRSAIDTLLGQLTGKTLSDVFLFELITDKECKEFLANASKAIAEGNYLDALVEARKAIFLEIESAYSIYEWRKDVDYSSLGLLAFMGLGGLNAPSYTRSKSWIDEHVNEPFDYIQLDHKRVRDDLVEWGVNTQDFWNVWRLTPVVFRGSKDDAWQIRKEPKFYGSGATFENARYCLDTAIHIILKKQDHFDLIKHLRGSAGAEFSVVTTSDPTMVYAKASSDAPLRDQVEAGIELPVLAVVPGLANSGLFLQVRHFSNEYPANFTGYVLVEDTDIAKQKGKE